MIAWAGVVAKLAEYIATKLIGKKIDMTLDKKSRAAKAFLTFHNAFIELDDVLSKTIDLLDNACNRRKPVIFSKELLRLVPKIQEVSKSFLSSLSSTTAAIQIIDPRLSELLKIVASFKGTYFSPLAKLLLTNKFEVEFTGLHPFKTLSFTKPDSSVLEIDYETYYAMTADVTHLLIPASWAQEQLVKAMQQGISQYEIGPRDYDKARALCIELKEHRQRIAVAREALREFISKTFSIEDLLFH